MAKKADLEESFRACSARCAEAARAEADGDYPRAVERAAAALPALRAWVVFLRRYQKVEAPDLPPVELILKYAPPLFAGAALQAVEAWAAEAGRPERALYPDLPARLGEARRRLALAVRVWPAWPAAAPSTSPAADPAEVTELLDFWVLYGAVVRRGGLGPGYEPVTHPRRPARGKCGRCGRDDRAAWAELLEDRACPQCGARSHFVIVPRTD